MWDPLAGSIHSFIHSTSTKSYSPPARPWSKAWDKGGHRDTGHQAFGPGRGDATRKQVPEAKKTQEEPRLRQDHRPQTTEMRAKHVQLLDTDVGVQLWGAQMWGHSCGESRCGGCSCEVQLWGAAVGDPDVGVQLWGTQMWGRRCGGCSCGDSDVRDPDVGMQLWGTQLWGLRCGGCSCGGAAVGCSCGGPTCGGAVAKGRPNAGTGQVTW